METHTEMFQYTKSNQNEIIAEFGKIPEVIKDDVKSIRIWLDSQNHLPNVISDKRIEKLLICSKFSLERVKQKIEWYFMVKKCFPQFFQQPLCKEILETFTDCYIITFPKLSPNNERIILTGIQRPLDFEKFSLNMAFAHTIHLSELILEHDYFSKVILMHDLKYVNFEFMLKMNPVELKKIVLVLEKAYTMRFSKIYLFNGPPFTVKLFESIKNILSSKLKDRIHFLEDGKFILEKFPKDIVPLEFGGTEKSILELKKMSFKVIKENEELLQSLTESRIDETKKPLELINDEFLGFYGSFRQADFD